MYHEELSNDETESSKSDRCVCCCHAGPAVAQSLPAATSFDGGGNSNWWFDPLNWSRETPTPPCPCLPPSQDDGTGVVTASDAQINEGSLPTWDLTGEGVVYDPANDPFFAAAAGFNYPTGSPAAAIVGSDYGPEHIYRFYVSRTRRDGESADDQEW